MAVLAATSHVPQVQGGSRLQPPTDSVSFAVQAATPLDAYEDFKRIFERFATAEQVTGTEPLGDSTDEEAEPVDDGKQVPAPAHSIS